MDEFRAEKELNLGTGPTDASCLRREPTLIVSKEKTLQADGPIPGRRKALDQVGTSRKGLRPGADADKLIGIEDVLAGVRGDP